MATGQENRPQGQGSNPGGQGKGSTSESASRIQGMASSAAQQASEAASSLGKKAEEATSAVGSRIRNLGSSIREHTPNEGMFGKTSSAVAGTLESGGRYLEEHGLEGIGEDLTSLIRRNPIPALLVGCGIGFLLGRAVRR